MKTTLNKLFRSKARVIHLSHFSKGRLVWERAEGENSYSHTFELTQEVGHFPKMPVILQSDGLPWDIANAYLVGLLEKPNISQMRTLTARATHLKYYLQYLEDSGQHFLDLPQKYHERVTQRFSAFMKRVLDEYSFSAEHINNIISTVAHFYTNIRYESLLPEERFFNEPFTPINKTIMTTSRVGLVRKLNVVTNDLRIRSSRRQLPELGRLRDGSSLRPITVEEQYVVQDAFTKNYASIELELMMQIALETGARQQTICTLSLGCIKDTYKILQRDADVETVTIITGHGYRADTKNGRVNKLIFRKALMDRVMLYIECERSETRRLLSNSFYRDTDDNYVFLTRQGNPYLTAQREIVDRQDCHTSWGLNSTIMVPKNGQALRNELIRFIKKIQRDRPGFNPFTFHDLRASMGMNVVRWMRRKDYPDSKIFDHVRKLLNHSDLKTTERYLNFDEELADYQKIQESFGDELYGHSLNV